MRCYVDSADMALVVEMYVDDYREVLRVERSSEIDDLEGLIGSRMDSLRSRMDEHRLSKESAC